MRPAPLKPKSTSPWYRTMLPWRARTGRPSRPRSARTSCGFCRLQRCRSAEPRYLLSTAPMPPAGAAGCWSPGCGGAPGPGTGAPGGNACCGGTGGCPYGAGAGAVRA
ncbi:LEPR-XLL domain-containing protein, partial [Streptomyces sp. URMC 129]|uniref:LEPR-XLL domain-containing protein n=1 Tax=Streptomyces sp. URMC 129 TaxID=3423407 RepID=UPI003F1B0273